MDILSDVNVIGNINTNKDVSANVGKFSRACIGSNVQIGSSSNCYMLIEKYGLFFKRNNSEYSHIFNYVFTNIGPIPANCNSFVVGDRICGVDIIDVPGLLPYSTIGNHITLFKQVSNPIFNNNGFEQFKVIEADVSFIKYDYNHETAGYLIEIAPHSDEITDLFAEFM